MWLDKFNEMRKASGLSLDALSEASGVPKGTLAKITSGATKTPSLETVKSLVYAMGYSLSDLDDFNSKKAPSLSDEAMKIAKDYSSLDSWGRTAVRELVSTEKQRCEDETRFMEDTQLVTFEPKVINRYLEPSAAGIAAPVEGKDFEPYELGPDDPPGAAYAIRVQGDSMEPDFPDGSTVFVNHDAIVNGDIGVFCVDGGTVIKQYYRDPFGMTYLFSLNRKRADADVPIYPSSGQTVICQGRVITKRRYPLPRL